MESIHGSSSLLISHRNPNERRGLQGNKKHDVEGCLDRLEHALLLQDTSASNGVSESSSDEKANSDTRVAKRGKQGIFARIDLTARSLDMRRR